MSDVPAFEQRLASALETRGLVPATHPTQRRGIRVHRNTAMKAAQDALVDNYPVVRALVGEEAFAACAAGYAEANPPCDPRLCIYGRQFDAFLSGYVPFGNLSWMAGMARLEWRRNHGQLVLDARN